MNSWTSFVLRHRLLVALTWLLIAVAGGLTASTTVSRLTYDFRLPDQPAYEANLQIIDQFGGGGGENDPLLMVLRPTEQGAGLSPVAEQQFAAAAAQITEAMPGTRVLSAKDSPSLLADDRSVSVLMVYPPIVPGPEPYAKALPALQQQAAQMQFDRARVQVTGFGLIAEGSEGESRSVLIEVILGGVGALVVLALVFGSLLAGVPLLVAAVSILGTFLCLFALTALTDVVFVVQYLVALIGLGVAIDYSLLIVMRWREERAAGAQNDEAVRTAMRTSGRSVVFSGVTVAVSLAALVVVPLPFLRSIGLGGLLIPLLSVLTATTLVPALLSGAGPRLQWPRKRVSSPVSRTWGRLATWVVRRRWAVIAGTVVVLAALAAPIFGLALGSPQVSALQGSSGAAATAGAVTDGGLPPGVFRPIQIVVPGADAAAALEQLTEVDGVADAVAPTAWAARGDRLLLAWTSADPSTDDGRATLAAVRALDLGQVGGSPAEDADFVTAVYGDSVWIVLAVVVVTFLLLARALRSFWLPVKALVLNVISLAAAYGITVLIWQEGVGTDVLFDADASGAITTWVPIAAFAFLFGLSMDYEVFILARMREAYDDHGDTPRAVVDGIANTGRLVTSAALILFFAFVALSTVPSVQVKILATALALGIAIDAVIVRALLAPALVAVLGRANWTLPSWLAWVLRLRRGEDDQQAGSGRSSTESVSVAG